MSVVLLSLEGGYVKMKRSLFGLVALCGVILIVLLIAQSYGLLPDFRDNSDESDRGSIVGYMSPWEVACFDDIVSRVQIFNPSPDYTGVRELEWYVLRNASSHEYYQKTVNYWCFQSGRGLDGDIDAFVEIYNVPNDTGTFVVEIARNTWWALDVYLDDVLVYQFPQMSENGNALGYCTFEITPNV